MMPESFFTRLARWRFNWYPAYRGTGAWITYIAADWREIRVDLPLSWQTRNVVGVIFGGSIYAAVDPFYMIILMRNLGPDYRVWDKAATVRFKKPGTRTLRAVCRVDQAELDEIQLLLLDQPRLDRLYTIELTDTHGELCATVEKTIYIARAEK